MKDHRRLVVDLIDLLGEYTCYTAITVHPGKAVYVNAYDHGEEASIDVLPSEDGWQVDLFDYTGAVGGGLAKDPLPMIREFLDRHLKGTK